MNRQERREITLQDTVKDTLVLLSEGNPGALNVLMRLANEEAGGSFFDMLHLDDMNIRGTQVWVAYKDFAQENMGDFVKAVRARDPQMVQVVNDAGVQGNHSWKAVTGQASSGNRSQL